MKFWKIDLETRIFNLSLEIKHLVEEYDLDKRVIVSDFEDLINSNFEEEKDEV